MTVFAKQGIKIGETVLGLFYLKAVFNGQPKELKVVGRSAGPNLIVKVRVAFKDIPFWISWRSLAAMSFRLA